MTGELVKATPIVLDVVSKALGRTPTQQELVDLAPIAVMVQAFYASAGPDDTMTVDIKQWSHSFLFGLYDSNGQEIEVKTKKGKRS